MMGIEERIDEYWRAVILDGDKDNAYPVTAWRHIYHIWMMDNNCDPVISYNLETKLYFARIGKDQSGYRVVTIRMGVEYYLKFCAEWNGALGAYPMRFLGIPIVIDDRYDNRDRVRFDFG